jgi:hypothetical protein
MPDEKLITRREMKLTKIHAYKAYISYLHANKQNLIAEGATIWYTEELSRTNYLINQLTRQWKL